MSLFNMGRSRGVRAGKQITQGVSPFFADNLQGGQFNPANGFQYYNNGGNPQISSARAVNGGTHSIKMAYDPSAAGEDSNCELRFRMGRLIREVWVEYWLYVPSNFYMRETVNNKFFSLWRDVSNNADGNWSYGGWNDTGTMETTQKFTIEYWGLGGPGAVATTRVAARVNNQFYVTDVDTPTNQTALIGPGGPLLIGQWNRVRQQFSGSTGAGVADGTYKMWINDTLKHNVTNYNFSNPAERYNGSTIVPQTPRPDVAFDVGYFLGYANTGFNELTEFFIGDIKFYDQNPEW